MMRIVGRAVLLSLLVLVGLLILFSVYRFMPLAQRCRTRRLWSRMLLAISGVALQVERSHGQTADSPMLVVMNHVSWLDIFVLNSVMPATFIAKSEIRRWPLVGWLLVGTDTLFIERASRHAVRHVNHQILERLASGEHVAFFPESTTSDGSMVLPFHSSLFAMAITRTKSADGSVGAAVAPPCVLPVVLRYFQHDAPSLIPAYIGDQTFLESVLQIISARGLRVRLRMLEPMMPPGPEISRQMLAQMAHQRVSSALAGLD